MDAFLGFGLGLRTQHYSYILEHRPEIDWFEAITEDYLVPGGKPLHYLNRIREHYPLVMHGVSLSIGSCDPLNREYLKKVKALADKGDVFTSDKDKNILSNIDILSHINSEYKTIRLEDKLESLVELLTTSRQQVYPVVNAKNQLLGVIEFEKLRPIVFNPFRIKYTTIQEHRRLVEYHF